MSVIIAQTTFYVPIVTKGNTFYVPIVTKGNTFYVPIVTKGNTFNCNMCAPELTDMSRVLTKQVAM